jgi:hypothetical protein
MKAADVSCGNYETYVAHPVFNRADPAITAPVRIDFAGTASDACVNEMCFERYKSGTVARRLFSRIFMNLSGKYPWSARGVDRYLCVVSTLVVVASYSHTANPINADDDVSDGRILQNICTHRSSSAK